MGKPAVYLIWSPNDTSLKIGLSKDPRSRMGSLGLRGLKLLEAVEFSVRAEAAAVESYLHGKYSAYRHPPRTVGSSSGGTEWFADVPEIRETFVEAAQEAAKLWGFQEGERLKAVPVPEVQGPLS